MSRFYENRYSYRLWHDDRCNTDYSDYSDDYDDYDDYSCYDDYGCYEISYESHANGKIFQVIYKDDSCYDMDWKLDKFFEFHTDRDWNLDHFFK